MIGKINLRQYLSFGSPPLPPIYLYSGWILTLSKSASPCTQHIWSSKATNVRAGPSQWARRKIIGTTAGNAMTA